MASWLMAADAEMAAADRFCPETRAHPIFGDLINSLLLRPECSQLSSVLHG